MGTGSIGQGYYTGNMYCGTRVFAFTTNIIDQETVNKNMEEITIEENKRRLTKCSKLLWEK